MWPKYVSNFIVDQVDGDYHAVNNLGKETLSTNSILQLHILLEHG